MFCLSTQNLTGTPCLFRTRNLVTVSADCTIHAEHLVSRLPVDSLHESEESSHFSLKLVAFFCFCATKLCQGFIH